jgi:hypothetical protein
MKSPAQIRFCGALILALAAGCSKPERVDPVPAVPVELIEQAKEQHQLRLELAEARRDPSNGWLTPDDCDGLLWSGKYGAVVGFDPYAAEYPDQPGRFARRPVERGLCYTDEGVEQGAKSSCSRDQAMGLIAYAVQQNNPEVLQAHYDFVKSNNWKCGEGQLSATYYNPFFRGFLEAVMDGLALVQPRWPAESEYFAGLDDYEAHLQMLNIDIRQTIEGSVTEAMLARIVEHSDREPGNPFFWYLRGKYSGDMAPAVKACVDGTYGTYVRCGVGLDKELCVLSELIYACDRVLRYFDEPAPSLL